MAGDREEGGRRTRDDFLNGFLLREKSEDRKGRRKIEPVNLFIAWLLLFAFVFALSSGAAAC